MSEHLGHSQLEDIKEIHVRNPNYKGKNYDPIIKQRKLKQTSNTSNLQQPTGTSTRLPTPSLQPAATLTTWPVHRT